MIKIVCTIFTPKIKPLCVCLDLKLIQTEPSTLRPLPSALRPPPSGSKTGERRHTCGTEPCEQNHSTCAPPPLAQQVIVDVVYTSD